MRFHKNVPAENRAFLREQLKQYKKEISMTKEELQELEEWVASGRSPYDNGNYIYNNYGYPMDFVSALRFLNEEQEWFNSLSDEEREEDLRSLRSNYDTFEDDVAFIATDFHMDIDPDEELPFN